MVVMVCGLVGLAARQTDVAANTSKSSKAAIDGAEQTSDSPKENMALVESSPSPLAGIDLEKMRLVEGRYQQKTDDGRQVTFTVDPELQLFSDNLFERYQVPAGAAVIIQSRTGRVLSFAQQRKLVEAADSRDVGLDSSPPAASVFKIITAAALLEQSAVSTSTETCYRGGGSKLLMENLQDWPREKSACASLSAALGRSINAIFAKLSDRHLDRATLSRYAARFGFNAEIPFDVEVPQSIADIPAGRLDRARTAAGFWHTHLSPLHGAVIAQSLAQGGAMLQPYIVDNVASADGTVLHEAKTKYLGNTVSKETAQKLIKAMTYTVSHGTARKSFRDGRGVPFLPGMDIAAKTGTLTGAKPYRAYTWFVGLAPADKPEVAIAVLVVNDPKWRIKAAGAAAQLLKKYFEIQKSKKS
jgi:penicillin-binding protein A